MPVDIYALLALLSAFFNGAATILIRQGLQDATAQTGYWINLVVGVAGLWLAVSLLTPGDVFAIRALPYFIAAGLIGTVGGRFTRFLAIDKVGASVASSIINLNPFISAGLAIALLGERVTLPILAGTVVIVVGTILLSSSRRQAGFRLRHLIYPLHGRIVFWHGGDYSQTRPQRNRSDLRSCRQHDHSPHCVHPFLMGFGKSAGDALPWAELVVFHRRRCG